MSNNHFYKLLFNTQEKKLSTIIDQEITRVPYDIFRRCSKIELSTAKSISTSTLKTKDVEKMGDYIENSIDWPICSTKMANILISLCTDAIEIIDAPKIIDLKGKEHHDAKAFNVLPSPKCIDLDRSNVVYSADGKIRGIYDIAISANHEIDPDTHIFRPREWPSTIIISKQLAQAFTAAKLSGLAYEPIDS